MASICYAANVNVADDKSSFDVYPEPPSSGPTFTVTTLHISCQSDTYRGSGCLYGGIIMYGRNDMGEWYTANNTHCKSGYVVITRTDTKEFKELQDKWSEPGQVHGVIYRKAFGESLNDVKAVGEGFGIKHGAFNDNSGALNPTQDHYHDKKRGMHEDSARVVKALVEIWKDAGAKFPARRNYTVKELGL